MATSFKFDHEKAVAAIKFVLRNLDGRCNFHNLFKILYFAEQKHLSQYGRPIFADTYIAMKDGPVPSAVYDMMKIIKGDSMYFNPAVSEEFAKLFIVEDYWVKINDQTLDLDVFSQSELESLLNSIAENKFLNYQTLADKSHDFAWNNSERNQKISVLDMAKAGGANEELLKYITLTIENEDLKIK